MNLSDSSGGCQSPEVKMQSRLRQSFFASLWESKLFADYEIHVEDQVIIVHKVVLCTFSDVFLAMLTNDYKENTNSKITITDFSYKVVQLMLEYIYVGEFTMEMEEYVDDLLRIAEKYNIIALKAKLARKIESKLGVDSVLKILVLADTSNVQKLKEKAIAFIRLNYRLVRASDEFITFYKQHPALLLSILDAEFSYTES